MAGTRCRYRLFLAVVATALMIAACAPRGSEPGPYPGSAAATGSTPATEPTHPDEGAPTARGYHPVVALGGRGVMVFAGRRPRPADLEADAKSLDRFL